MKLPILNVALTGLWLSSAVTPAYSAKPPILKKPVAVENVIIHTPSQEVTARSEFHLSFALPGHDGEFILFLEPNNELLEHSPSIQYLDHNSNVRRTETINREEHRVFKGTVMYETTDEAWERAGWARIYLVQDGATPLFEGAFSVFSQHYHVEMVGSESTGVDASDLPSHMMVSHEKALEKRHGEQVPERPLCGVGQGQFAGDVFEDDNDLGLNIPGLPAELQRRQFTPNSDDLSDTIGNSDGCPTDRRVALVGIATDCSYTASFTSNDELRRSVINMVNSASEVFEDTFNVSLGLHNLTISESDCPNTASASTPWNAQCSAGSLNWRMREFSSWRGTLGDSTNAYWTLMSGCRDGGEVGISWVGGLCNTNMGANVVVRTSNQWQVFAHETGHTFGAVHDCESRTCSSSSNGQCCPLSSSTCDANGDYIMNPFSTSSQTEFSQCTVGNVCSLMGSSRLNTRCLVSNNNVPTITTGQCGNGIVEGDEECDCGGDCDGNECCDGSTCRFRDGAVCDDSTGSCCNNCQYASSDTVCRPSTGSCDVEETCPGDSGTCPEDRHERDGQSCGSSTGLFCASGECTSRDMQCRDTLQANSTGVASCDDDSCTLRCSVDWNGSGYCMNTNQQALDGTPCGGGTCQRGRCSSDSDSDGGSVSSWVQRHLSLVIGLSAGIGGALLLGVLACIICCCCSRRRNKHKPVPVPVPARMPAPAMRGPVAWPYPPPPPPPPAYHAAPMQAPPINRGNRMTID